MNSVDLWELSVMQFTFIITLTDTQYVIFVTQTWHFHVYLQVVFANLPSHIPLFA